MIVRQSIIISVYRTFSEGMLCMTLISTAKDKNLDPPECALAIRFNH